MLGKLENLKTDEGFKEKKTGEKDQNLGWK
jgi:hypothetical protein